MGASKVRYFLPVLFFIIIGGTAAFIIWDMTSGIVQNVDIMGVGVVPLPTIIAMFLLASVPILLLEYFIFAIPIAAVFLIVNRFAKAASYEMNIMNIGREFSGRHMVRRAAAPALFSVASSDMLRIAIGNYIFPNTVLEAGSLEFATVSLMGALLFMPVALLIFMPTWVLNDTGIVTHLKESRLNIRQCPDTQGVGRWVSSIFGGFALIAFPITMFSTHLLPHILAGQLFDQNYLRNALLLIAGLPVFVMAFIMPVIMFNERSQVRVRRTMANLATKLGATVIRKERIEKSTRFRTEGILTEDVGKEIVSTAKSISMSKTENEVVASKKSAKKDKQKKPKKKTKKKKS
jgi:hypothetical protein